MPFFEVDGTLQFGAPQQSVAFTAPFRGRILFTLLLQPCDNCRFRTFSIPCVWRGCIQCHVLDVQLVEGFRRREFFKDYTFRLGLGAVLGLCTLEGRSRCGGLGRGEPRWRLGLWPCLLGFFQFRDLFLKRLSCRAPAPSVPNFAPARVNVSRRGLLLGRPYLGLLLQVRHCAARSRLPFGLPLRRRDQFALHPLVRPALARTQAGGVLRAHVRIRRLFMGGLLARARRLRRFVSRPARLRARCARGRMRRHGIGSARRRVRRARVARLDRRAWRADDSCCVG